MSATLDLAKQLIELPSVTPEDKGCQEIIAKRLEKLGFKIEHLPFENVSNLWAQLGNEGPLFIFAGHTDVVPAGPLDEWSFDPFTAQVHDGFLYGRGAADMKSSLAAMITATERFLEDHKLKSRLGFLISSDEEGQAINGTRKVVETLLNRSIQIDYCLVGEPSSSISLGDTIKIGRRGSLNCKLNIIGIKGHIAYPHLASNPIHAALPALKKLMEMEWDTGNEVFPPTSFQISNIHAGVGTDNVIPGSMEIDFNLRFSTEIDAETIKKVVIETLDQDEINYETQWHLSGEPFLTTKLELIDVVTESVTEVTGITPQQSTSGGTSDGRFISPAGAQVVEFGPCNATIHKIDECIEIKDIELLSCVYETILRKLA